MNTYHKLDSEDKLAKFRDRFHIPKHTNGEPMIYFCGNSLGLQPKSTQEFLNQELKDWAEYAVEGHFRAKRPWMPYHENLSPLLAQIAGALPSEVVAMNSLTVNLHLLMVSFYRPTATKFKILTEAKAFPSDSYAVHSQIEFHNLDPKKAWIQVNPDNNAEISTEKIIQTISENKDTLAMILLGGVNYYSGQVYDIEKITKYANELNITIGWDLAHAAGNIELKLHDWGVDFAAWCSYKYLNAGPGSIAAAFVHEKHHDSKLPRFEGWWGHEKSTRFKMEDTFIPMKSAEAWQLSNPPIFAMAPLIASLEIFQDAGLENLRAKAHKLTEYMLELLQEIPQIEIITPIQKRGSQLSLRLKSGNAKGIFDQLEPNGIIADWREPDVIRIAPIPLYNSFQDVFQFANILKNIIK